MSTSADQGLVFAEAVAEAALDSDVAYYLGPYIIG